MPAIRLVLVNLARFARSAVSLRKTAVFIAVLSGLAITAYGGYASYLKFATRHISVCVATDLAFRYEKPNWRYRVGLWFAEVNRAFKEARIEWQPSFWDGVFTDKTALPLEERRRALAENPPCASDVVLGLSGQRDPETNSSVAPFNPVLLVVLAASDSDSTAVSVLSSAFAQLFGATTSTATVVSTDSPEEILDARSLTIAEKLRAFPFASGISALAGHWEQRAAGVIAGSYVGKLANPAMEAHRVLGRAFASGNLHGNAANRLRDAVKADPRNLGLRLELAIELNLDARMDEALEQLSEAARIEPEDARPHAARAAILLNTRRTPEGIEELRTAARLDPHNANYLAMLGSVLAPQVGGADEARKAFVAALRVRQREDLARWGLSAIEAAPAAAQAEVAKAQAQVRQHPDSSEAAYGLGLALAASADSVGARSAFRRSVALDPKNADAHLALAQLHYMSGDLSAALEELKTGEAAGGKASAAFAAELNRRLGKP